MMVASTGLGDPFTVQQIQAQTSQMMQGTMPRDFTGATLGTRIALATDAAAMADVNSSEAAAASPSLSPSTAFAPANAASAPRPWLLYGLMIVIAGVVVQKAYGSTR